MALDENRRGRASHQGHRRMSLMASSDLLSAAHRPDINAAAFGLGIIQQVAVLYPDDPRAARINCIRGGRPPVTDGDDKSLRSQPDVGLVLTCMGKTCQFIA